MGRGHRWGAPRRRVLWNGGCHVTPQTPLFFWVGRGLKPHKFQQQHPKTPVETSPGGKKLHHPRALEVVLGVVLGVVFGVAPHPTSLLGFIFVLPGVPDCAVAMALRSAGTMSRTVRTETHVLQSVLKSESWSMSCRAPRPCREETK